MENSTMTVSYTHLDVYKRQFCDFRDAQFDMCTNSTSFLTALDNPSTVDPSLQQLIALCHALNDLGASTSFVWCPGHVGIGGNEEAGAAARHAADSPQDDAIANTT